VSRALSSASGSLSMATTSAAPNFTREREHAGARPISHARSAQLQPAQCAQAEPRRRVMPGAEAVDGSMMITGKSACGLPRSAFPLGCPTAAR